ncbi:MAG: 6-phosphogluconolactonase [bacterium]|nr:6-phosphogluconolactonase [bacterium]
MLTVLCNSNTIKLAHVAAGAFTRHVNELLTRQDYVVVALPGGRSVREFFAVLKQEDIAWQKIHFFMLDERLVSLEDDDSNYKAAKEQFFDFLIQEKNLPAENVHPFIYDAKTADFGLKVYEAELKQFGGKYDIVVAGVGEDGHTASLFPNHQTLDSIENFVLEKNSPKPPSERISASPALIKQTKVVLVFFIGEGKIDAYKKFNDENTDWHECPVKIFREVEKCYAVTNIK